MGPRPDKTYFSGVSPVPVTLSNRVEPAFIAFVKQKYGADIDPRCAFGATESGARDYLRAEMKVLEQTAVATGWVWTPSPNDLETSPGDTARRPAPRGNGH